jgi:hypothetical protein
MFNAGITGIKKISYSGIRYGLRLPWTSEANLDWIMIIWLFCVNIPLFGWLIHVSIPNIIKFQVPYISMSLFPEKLRLNYFQCLGNTLLSQQCELRHESAIQNRQLCGLSTINLALSFVLYRYNV